MAFVTIIWEELPRPQALAVGLYGGLYEVERCRARVHGRPLRTASLRASGDEAGETAVFQTQTNAATCLQLTVACK